MLLVAPGVVCRFFLSMNRGDFTAGRGRKPAVPDKVDMSLGKVLDIKRYRNKVATNVSYR